MAHSPRGWTGARTPSAIKRVRQTERRRAINQPRRTAAKTLVGKAMLAATDAVATTGSPDEVRAAVERAVSALDRAAKLGAIHRNAADRRKSRLMLKVNAALLGEGLTTSAAARQTSKAAAAKEAKARIAAGRAAKAKGAQTAAGKARAALAKTSRDASADKAAAAAAAAATAEAKPTTKAATKPAAKSTAKSSSAKSSTAKKATAKTSAKSTASKTAKKS